MIDKVALSQYMRVENKDTQTQNAASRKTDAVKVVTQTNQDKVAISNEAQKAEEVARYTKMAQNIPAVDEQKVKDLKKTVNEPGYLDSAAKQYAVHIADRLVEALYEQKNA